MRHLGLTVFRHNPKAVFQDKTFALTGFKRTEGQSGKEQYGLLTTSDSVWRRCQIQRQQKPRNRTRSRVAQNLHGLPRRRQYTTILTCKTSVTATVI